MWSRGLQLCGQSMRALQPCLGYSTKIMHFDLVDERCDGNSAGNEGVVEFVVRDGRGVAG